MKDEYNGQWERLGKADAYWAVLTDPKKKDNKWNSADFFRTGEKEIEVVFSDLKELNAEINFNLSLDFGCGVGRLSRALSKKFLVDRGTIKKVVEFKSYRNENDNIFESKKLENTTTNNKFTKEDIIWIRNNYKKHDPIFGLKPISIKFNTNETRIWKIVTYKVWKNI